MSEPLLELDVGAMASGGGCVARTQQGQVVFVRHCLPGERVRARVTETRKAYLRADAVEVLRPSPERVSPPCPYSGPGRCGGCVWQHVSLPFQRELKAILVAEQLRRIAGIERGVSVEQLPGGTDGLGWRSQVRFAVDESGRVGFRRHRSHTVQPVTHCPIASHEVETIGVEAGVWRGVEEIEAIASPSGGRLVAVSTRRVALPAGLPDTGGGLVVDGETLRGPEHVGFDVLGRRFEVSAGVFWQVHRSAAATLAGVVLPALDARPGDRVVDLYAGAGLFSGLIADRVAPGGRVLAVERDARAADDARRNLAGDSPVEIVTAAVTPALVAAHVGRSDLVVLDPPRQGAGTAVTAALADRLPRRLVYVSCDAASFARDLRLLLDRSWTLESLRAFDLFPMTEHVELVAVIVRPGDTV